MRSSVFAHHQVRCSRMPWPIHQTCLRSLFGDFLSPRYSGCCICHPSMQTLDFGGRTPPFHFHQYFDRHTDFQHLFSACRSNIHIPPSSTFDRGISSMSNPKLLHKHARTRRFQIFRDNSGLFHDMCIDLVASSTFARCLTDMEIYRRIDCSSTWHCPIYLFRNRLKWHYHQESCNPPVYVGDPNSAFSNPHKRPHNEAATMPTER
mmetsp:Transcript_8023/g.17119  ORF Transcript_8023/g.17119 Transcript_8023/m.17119 type:complete len:206 (+) Transcript_8023:732-1349(+)